MGRVTVKLFADLREVAGAKEFELLARDVAEARAMIVGRFGETMAVPLARCGALLNGENVKFLQGEKTRLRDGDTLSLLPPVAGG